MATYFSGMNKDTIQDKIREMSGEIPELEDVDLYQRKDDLIEEATEIINASVQPGDDPLEHGFKDNDDEDKADEETDGDEPEDSESDEVQSAEDTSTEAQSSNPGQQRSPAFQPTIYPEV